MTNPDPQQEYAEALEDYRAAMSRLIEAKRHITPSRQDMDERNARVRARRAERRVERNSPEAKAERERWEQQLANIGQRAIEERENMPDELRILTRVGNMP